jgi:hypothetical protein
MGSNMKNYDYYRDAWPQIVRDCFAHGGRMFAVIERCDDAGRVVLYERGRELDEAAALEFRGATMVEYGEFDQQKC